MITAIIVENNPEDVAELTQLLEKASFDVTVKGIYADVATAYEHINLQKPELVFLDIELEGYETGFDLLQMYEQLPFGVIFTSLHNTFNNAVRALHASALDFLAKPLNLSALEQAIEKFLRKSVAQRKDEFEVLKDNLQLSEGRLSEICIANINGHTRLEVSRILYCEADNVNTKFHLVTPLVDKPLANKFRDISQSTLISTRTLKHWEQALDGSDMCRTHRSYLVNLRYAVRFKSVGDGAVLILKEGQQIPVSRDRKQRVKERWKAYCKLA